VQGQGFAPVLDVGRNRRFEIAAEGAVPAGEEEADYGVGGEGQGCAGRPGSPRAGERRVAGTDYPPAQGLTTPKRPVRGVRQEERGAGGGLRRPGGATRRTDPAEGGVRLAGFGPDRYCRENGGGAGGAPLGGVCEGADRGAEEADGGVGEGRAGKDRVHRQRDRVMALPYFH
jgi:hypothetical protein